MTPTVVIMLRNSGKLNVNAKVSKRSAMAA
ncbi:Uncharacterised protein [Vibrio cholerae]|nr:Uncharacterised protein [Vibrio cholerae]